MPSTRAFLGPNIVQPTKYVVPPTRVAKELPPEPWQLPKSEPFVRASYSLSRLQDNVSATRASSSRFVEQPEGVSNPAAAFYTNEQNYHKFP